MKPQTITLETAAARNAKIIAINQALREIEPDLSAGKASVDTLKNQIASIRYVLDKEFEPLPLHATRGSRMPKDEIDQKTAKIEQLKEQLNDALKTYEPLRDEAAEMTAERDYLEDNPPAATLEDLKTAQAKISALSVKAAQIKQAAEEAASKCPTDRIEALKEEIQGLSIEQDLMAADVDMGTGSESELKKLAGKLAKATKELSVAQEVASMAEATQRGYQRRLDSLNDELAAAGVGFRTMLSLYARCGFVADSKRIQSSINDIEQAFRSMENFNHLSLYEGDGSEFFQGHPRVEINLGGILGGEAKRIETDAGAARDNTDKVMASIQTGQK